MKKAILRFISVIVVICMTVGILLYLTRLLERKQSYYKYYQFFNEENDYDVLFLGTSHVINGIYPLELWNDYGIVSYNFGGHGNPIPTSYWAMINALEYTTPKLVVIDCLGCTGGGKTSYIEYLHMTFDEFPLSINKIRAIEDLFGADPNKVGLIWDFSVYHNKWSEISEEDFNANYIRERGAEQRIGVVPITQSIRIDDNDIGTDNSLGELYLRKMIEECQKRKIDVLLTFLPFNANETQQMDANRTRMIAEEYKLDYLNFLDIELVNYRTDFYDEEGHLNPSGARKVTNYIGSVISTKFDVPDNRNNPDYKEEWDYNYAGYLETKEWNIKSEEDLATYLMLLSEDDLDVGIYRGKAFENIGDTRVVDLISDRNCWKYDKENEMVISVKRDGDIVDESTWIYKDGKITRDLEYVKGRE